MRREKTQAKTKSTVFLSLRLYMYTDAVKETFGCNHAVASCFRPDRPVAQIDTMTIFQINISI